MDAGIGASAGIDANRRDPRDRDEREFEHLLHGSQSGLCLPAVELGAILTEDEAEIRHGDSIMKRGGSHMVEQLSPCRG